jgi:hypothetical protein
MAWPGQSKHTPKVFESTRKRVADGERQTLFLQQKCFAVEAFEGFLDFFSS